MLTSARPSRSCIARGSVAAPAGEGKPAHWANDRSVPAADKADLFAWLESNRPEDDPADATLPRTYADGWLTGKPDAVYEFPKGVPARAYGTLPYQNITVETDLTEDRG